MQTYSEVLERVGNNSVSSGGIYVGLFTSADLDISSAAYPLSVVSFPTLCTPV